MSPTRINRSLALWKAQLPTVAPYYAVKCNPAPQLLRHLYDADIGFDCASERELLEIRSLGAAAKRIVYANPCKSIRDLRIAETMGSPMTVVDSVEEVEKLGRYWGGALIRIAVDDTASAMPFSSKFGAAVEDVGRIGGAAAAFGLQIRGISFHVGSGSTDKDAHGKASSTAIQCLKKLAAQGHKYANIIDIGGGYLADTTKFIDAAASIRGAQKDTNYTWIAEPGRFIAADAFDFYVQVIGKKRHGAGCKYTIDDSLYGQFSSILFDYAAPSWIRISEPGDIRGQSPGIIFGRTCDSVDVIARAEAMEELRVGDWLWFPEMGAYTRATASEFNGFPRPDVYVDDAEPMTSDEFNNRLSVEDYILTTPTGVTRMPPVSAKAFWG